MIQLSKFFKNYIRLKEEDEKRDRISKENKRMMREYLDMQVEEKRRFNEFERSLDDEQARIWRIDCEKYHEQEKDINDKVNIFFNFF
jgi:hypothetical protein